MRGAGKGAGSDGLSPLGDAETQLDLNQTSRASGEDNLYNELLSEPRERGEALELQPGASLGRYVVLRTLGAGGVGIVYLAYDPELDRRVAVKLINRETRRRANRTEARGRLVREARAMAQLNHPNIITIHDVGTFNERVFLAMEYIEGETLGEWFKRQPRTVREIVRVFTEAARGLLAVHEAGFIHRDFKPDNVMISARGDVRVMDFGLVRGVGEDSALGLSSQPEISPGESQIMARIQSRLNSESMTRTGLTMGTPAYMSPEQHSALPLDPRSDQFSYCVTLYEALYGKRPFAGRTLPELASAVINGRVEPPPRGRRAPAWLRRLVLRGLSPDRARRHPSMEVVIDTLRGRTRRRRRRWIGVASTAALASAAAFGVAEWRDGQRSLCSDGEELLAGVWDEPRRQALARVFQDSKLSYAVATWERVKRLLDRRTSEWLAARVEACEATRVHGVQSEALLDQRMRCYGRWRDELRVFSDVLASADERAIESALDAAYELSSIEACADLEALGAVEDGVTPLIRVELDDLEAGLTRARTLGHLGRYRDALAIEEDMVKRARALEHPRALGDALLAYGRRQRDLGRYEAAEATLRESIELASRAGNDAALVRGWTSLATLVGDDLVRAEEGLVLAEVARLAAVRGGDLPDEELRVVMTAGTLLYTLGRYDEAIAKYRRALDLTITLDGPDDPEVAGALNNLANVLDDKGVHEEAIQHYRRALEIFERALGDEHPNVATNLLNLASALDQLAAYDESLAAAQRALKINAAAFGEEHVATANPSCHIGLSLAGLGRFAEARPYFERALERWEAQHGPDHPVLAYALAGIGRVELQRGRVDDALPRFERALALRERAYGPEHVSVAESLADLASARVKAGESIEARRLLARAVKIAEAALTPGHHKLARMRFAYARALFDTAGAFAEKEPGVARAERERAIALARTARAGLANAPGQRAGELAAIDRWILARDGT
ncbi:MAG: tetratricopeptide repeat protein [Myxococcales bacterium]|nr:tetratricopeptide repeat protein [Myxococcales bacterium]